MDVTHEVFNQPEPLVNYNLFEGNRPLRDALKFNAPGLDTAGLVQLSARLGTAGMQTQARLANVHLPELHTHDRFGRRLDSKRGSAVAQEAMECLGGNGDVEEGGEGVMARIQHWTRWLRCSARVLHAQWRTPFATRASPATGHKPSAHCLPSPISTASSMRAMPRQA